MVIGGATGAAVWRVAHIAGLGSHDQLAFVIVGMAACFGAVAHAPVAVLLMVAEMTGSLALLPPAMVALVVASVAVGGTTIYRSQLGRRSDSPAHRFGFPAPGPSTTPVSEVMTRPRLVLDGSTPAGEALRRLTEMRLPGAPVVNPDGSFIGSAQTPVLRDLVGAGETGPVGRLADTEAMTLPAESGLDAAIEALPASKGGWVPVLDDRMQVLGIVSSTDLVRGWQQTMRQSVRALSAAARSTVLLEGRAGLEQPTPIATLGLPPGTTVVSVLRDGSLIFPDGRTELTTGDHVTVLTRQRHAGAATAALHLEQVSAKRPNRPLGEQRVNGVWTG
jgi:CBS domain-containing protein